MIDKLGKSFAGPVARVVFTGVDFAIAPGELVAIVGESGVGKSTFLNLIAGLDQADAGRIVFEGVELGALDDDALTRIRRKSMGFVFQAFHLLPYLTVAENIALPLRLLGTAASAMAGPVADALAGVGLTGRGQSMPAELSGGESQRVAIARALIHRPKLVLADEPTGNLDPANGARILALLRERSRATGAAVALVTHSSQAAAVADRVMELTATGFVPRGAPL